MQALLEEYISLRKMGVDANTALQPLRSRIEKLSESDRAELVRRVREWERTFKGNPPPVVVNAEPDDEPSSLGVAPHGVIKKVSPLRTQTLEIYDDTPLPPVPGSTDRRPAITIKAPPAIATTPSKAGNLPPAKPEPAKAAAAPQKAKPAAAVSGKPLECPKCHRVSPSTEIFCPACGTFLQEDAAAYQTVRFDADEGAISPDYFGAKTILVLHVRHNKNQYRIQPQDYDREIIVGRGDVTATVAPDIDLANQGAGELGVSRMHLSIHYDKVHNTLSVTDLRSSNGSFVNNQRLHPHEVRVLRHGDEIRLGRLTLGIAFQHHN